MIWIEFTGPSGVGKSFWYQKIMDRDRLLCPKTKVVENFIDRSNSLSIINIIYKVFYKLNFKRESCKNRLFNYIYSKFSFFYEESDYQHVNLFLKGLNNYDSNPTHQLRLADYYHAVFKHYKLYEYYLDEKDYFLSEDGIIHTNFGFLNFDESMINLPRLIINFNASDEYILNNRRGRVKAGRPNLIEQVIQESDLDKYIIKHNKVYRKKIDQYRNMKNVTVVDFDIENVGSDQSKLKELISIIKNLRIK